MFQTFVVAGARLDTSACCCLCCCLCCCRCSFADSANRGIVNFGQTLVWYAAHLLACAKHRAASCSQLLLEPA
jgi:hypothetical protein